MAEGTGHVVVFSTAPNRAEAEQIGRTVVAERLAACCNVVDGIRSIYWWKGEVCEENEVLSIYKTRKELFCRLKERIKELHSYEVPEVIELEITGGLEEYLGWIETETGQ
ncbi:MAG: divalent-cation tolerance protein CutA [Proteobacteria bacterium]|nr:divalent-cation tolerance protein CutA [Pseudomonadota bacterium]